MATPAIPRPTASCPGVEHRAELLARARGILGRDADRAEDVVQEAYVHLLRRVGEGAAPHAPRAWLHSVVASLCLRELRGRRAEPLTAEPPASAADDPARRAVVAAQLRWAVASVAALPAREREALLADLAGRPPAREDANARHQALHRARRKLRALREAAWSLGPVPLLRWARRVAAQLPTAGGAAKGAVSAAAVVAAVAGGHLVAPHTADQAPPPTPRPPATAGAAPHSAPSAAQSRQGRPAAVVPRRRPRATAVTVSRTRTPAPVVVTAAAAPIARPAKVPRRDPLPVAVPSPAPAPVAAPPVTVPPRAEAPPAPDPAAPEASDAEDPPPDAPDAAPAPEDLASDVEDGA